MAIVQASYSTELSSHAVCISNSIIFMCRREDECRNLHILGGSVVYVSELELDTLNDTSIYQYELNSTQAYCCNFSLTSVNIIQFMCAGDNAGVLNGKGVMAMARKGGNFLIYNIGSDGVGQIMIY